MALVGVTPLFLPMLSACDGLVHRPPCFWGRSTAAQTWVRSEIPWGQAHARAVSPGAGWEGDGEPSSHQDLDTNVLCTWGALRLARAQLRLHSAFAHPGSYVYTGLENRVCLEGVRHSVQVHTQDGQEPQPGARETRKAEPTKPFFGPCSDSFT